MGVESKLEQVIERYPEANRVAHEIVKQWREEREGADSLRRRELMTKLIRATSKR
jgi:hypothetical protein